MDWFSYAMGVLSVVGIVFVSWFIVALTGTVRDALDLMRQRAALAELCANCMMPRGDHASTPIPGNPFNSYLACPKRREHWQDGEPEHEWKTRPIE